jgi:energy-coupling factor transport system substrate-specific component
VSRAASGPGAAEVVEQVGRAGGWARAHLPGLLAGGLVAAGSLLVVRGVSNPAGADWGVTSLVVVTALLMVGIAAASARLASAHQLALVGALAAFATASRLLFASLPNFKPVTFVVLTAGAALGPAPGFMIGATTALISNLFFGQGPWTPWQMLAWGVIGAVGGLLGLRGRRPRRWELVVVGAVGAVAFDWFVSLWMYLAFTARTWPALVALYAQGLVFDASHAAATVLFAALFGVQMVELIARFRRRTEVRLLPFEEGSSR